MTIVHSLLYRGFTSGSKFNGWYKSGHVCLVPDLRELVDFCSNIDCFLLSVHLRFNFLFVLVPSIGCIG